MSLSSTSSYYAEALNFPFLNPATPPWATFEKAYWKIEPKLSDDKKKTSRRQCLILNWMVAIN